MSSRVMLQRRLLPVGVVAPLLLLASPASAVRIDLIPPRTEVTIRFYGLGFFPIDGNYTRFRGSLAYDPADPVHCRADLTVDAASLTMADASMRDEVVGPEFMDAARFPTLAFSGACDGSSLGGDLTLHGITRPFALTLDWTRTRVSAAGMLRRALWGMTARLLLGGSTVRIRVSTLLPTSGEGSGR